MIQNQIRGVRKLCSVTFLLLTAVLLAVIPARAAGPKAYVGNFKDNTISVIDIAEKRVLTTVPIPPGPHGIVITPDNRWVYVASDGASTVSVIDTATDKLIENIEVGKNPHGLAITPDGKFVLVAVYDTDSVAFIDTANRKVVGTVPVGKPHNIAVHPKGTVAYVGSQTPGSFSLTIIDLQGRTVKGTVPLDKTPRGLEFGPSGKNLYITEAGVDSLVVIDPAVNKIVTQIPVGVSPHYANFTADGKRGLAVVQGPSLLAVFNPQTNSVEKSIKVGSQPHWVAVVPGNKTALTANESSNDVSIVDLESDAVTNIPVGGAPRKIAVQSSQAERSSSGRQISISGFAFSPPILEVSPGETVTWINDDGSPHRVALKNGAASDILLPTKSYSSTFEQVGNYDYFCSMHPYMTGKVVVTERQAATGLPIK
jgi:YVTN family beta-propeller protein